MFTSASDRRAASFWKGYNEEISYDSLSDTALKERVMALYGSGPRCGGRCRSDVAKLLGMDFHFVDSIIKEGIRERKKNVRRFR